MKTTFYISRKFDITRAPVGRLLARKIDDRLRLENIMLLTTVLGVVALVAIQYLLWAALSARILDNPTGPVAILFWCSQLGIVAGFLVGMLSGFSPDYELRLTARHLHIQGSDVDMTIPWNRVAMLATIDSDVYQKHYRRYRQTRVIGIVNSPQVVHLDVDNSPLFLALSEADLPEFERSSERMMRMQENMTIPSVTV